MIFVKNAQKQRSKFEQKRYEVKNVLKRHSLISFFIFHCKSCTNTHFLTHFGGIDISKIMIILYGVEPKQLNMNIPYHSWAAKRSTPTQ